MVTWDLGHGNTVTNFSTKPDYMKAYSHKQKREIMSVEKQHEHYTPEWNPPR